MNLKKRPFLVLIGLCVLLLAGSLPAMAQWTQIVGPRISIVWPHDGTGRPTSVGESRAVNVSVWPTGQTGCFADPGIQLLVAHDNEPANRVPGPGVTITRTASGVKFPSVEFNDVPANLALDPTSKFRFVVYGPVSSTAQGFSGNVWVHAADPRTYYPNPIVPSGYSTSTIPVQGMDARIQIVWPHDERGNFASVDRATRVNIGIEIFEHGTAKAVPWDGSQKYQYTVSLLVANGNGSLRAATYSSLVPIQYSLNGQTFTQWNFNDVPVQPWGQFHFVAGVTATGSTNMSPFSSIWTHAPDARTYLPYPQVPPPCVP